MDWAKHIADMYEHEIASIVAVLLKVPTGDRLNVLAVTNRAVLDLGLINPLRAGTARDGDNSGGGEP